MVSVTVRDVPDETRAELAARAAGSGRSLQEYLRGELIALASKPDRRVWAARVAERKRRTNSQASPAQILDAKDADRR